MSLRCNAKAKHSGQQCKRAAVNGTTKCDMHGGNSLRGPAHPNWKHGRHSKILPARLRERYESSLADPKTLELLDGIALIDARLEDVLKRVDTGEAGRLWKKLQELRAEYYEVMGDPVQERRVLFSILSLIERGYADWAAWEDARGLIRDRLNLVSAEQKRRLHAQQTLSLEQGYVLNDLLVDSVRRHVTDVKVLNAIATDWRRLSILQGFTEVDGQLLAIGPGDSRET